jgi:hypothetical protein
VEEKFCVISFESTHYAMMTEKKLKERYPLDMIPTPRCITASCGLSLKVAFDLIGDVIETLKSMGVDPRMFHIYQIKKNQRGNEATLIDWE